MNDKDIDQLFQEAGRIKPSEAVWLRIKEKIGVRPPAPAGPDLVRMFKPAMALVCLFVMLATAVFLKNNSFNQQDTYMAYLMEDDDTEDNVQTYFL